MKEMKKDSRKAPTKFADVVCRYKQAHRRSTAEVTDSVDKKVQEIGGENVMINDITRSFCKKFVKNAGKTLKPSSVKLYTLKLRNILDYAVSNKYIKQNPMPPIKELMPKPIVPVRTVLTVDEFRRLISAECPSENVKSAFLISCLIGLRLSDIRALCWEDIKDYGDNKYFVCLYQQKTKVEVHCPLCDASLIILKSLGWKTKGTIFNLNTRTTISRHLGTLAANAGISHSLTFHMSRHFFATSLYLSGSDLYTISKLVGHTNVRTTEIYTHISDFKLKESVDVMAKMLESTQEFENYFTK